MCECGKEFEAWVYKSINVSKDPELIALLCSKRFNVVKCPHCDSLGNANIPFLYHDMNKFLIWVYPEEAIEYEEEVKESIAEQALLLKETTPSHIFETSTFKNYKILFGKNSLIQFLLENDPEIDINIQYKHFYNGLKHYDQGNFQEAITLWNEAIEVDPDNSEIVGEAYFNIACAECKMGHMDKVSTLLENAIENGIEPEYVKFDPDIAEFRKDPRFKDIERKL